MEYDSEYIELINKNKAIASDDAKRMRRALEASSAHYHGFTVHTLYMPKFYGAEDIEVFRYAADTVSGIFDKVINEYIKNAEYRKLFGFDKRLERLILRPPLYSRNVPIARIDIFYNPETKDFKFCEFNTDGSSGMNEDRELNNVFRVSDTFAEFAKKHRVRDLELFDSWTAEFTEIFKESGRYKRDAHIAIADFMSSASNEEFEEFKRAFERAGYTCEICDILLLKRENKRLISPSGRVIDAVYRRAVTCDIMQNYDRVKPFIEAAENNEVVIIGDFKTQIVHNKLIFKILLDPMSEAILSDAENAFLKKHLPATYMLTRENVKTRNVISDRFKWIVKPSDSYASKGVLAGIEAKTEQGWKEFLTPRFDTDYLLQEYIPPYETENIDLLWDESAEFRKFVNITGLFVYNGKLKGLYSRTAKTGVISTQYSEMTLPTLIVD